MLKSFWNLKKKKGSANKAKIFCEKFLDWEFGIGLVAFMFVWSFKNKPGSDQAETWQAYITESFRE